LRRAENIKKEIEKDLGSEILKHIKFVCKGAVLENSEEEAQVVRMFLKDTSPISPSVTKNIIVKETGEIVFFFTNYTKDETLKTLIYYNPSKEISWCDIPECQDFLARGSDFILIEMPSIEDYLSKEKIEKPHREITDSGDSKIK
jgi:hypothetical protein